MRQTIDKSRRLTRPQQHMDLMGHEDRGVHGATLCRRRLLETRQGKAVIVYLEEEQLPIIPPLEDRLRDVWERLAGRPGHRKAPHGACGCNHPRLA